jgi:hypothetical protein|tara:strand:+ start:77 stop:844 length:768 start_codon:yes stop_codon:yes gene_type:complete
MLNLNYNTENPDSKCNWVMDSIKQGWPRGSHYWGFIQNNWKQIEEHRQDKVDWWFWDMPYHGRWLPDADNWYWRVSKNSVHCASVEEHPNDRFNSWNLEIQPWKKNGREILVCPSSDTMTRWCTGLGEKEWVQKTVEKIKRHTDRPVRVRYKPRANKMSGPMAEELAGVPAFTEDIKDVYAVVTAASMCAVDAIAYGIPIFCEADSFATHVGEQDISKIETPAYAERQLWFNHLAYQQYTQEEIASGLAYSIIGQ